MAPDGQATTPPITRPKKSAPKRGTNSGNDMLSLKGQRPRLTLPRLAREKMTRASISGRVTIQDMCFMPLTVVLLVSAASLPTEPGRNDALRPRNSRF